MEDAVAEPVVYMIDHFVVGGFYRVHTGRGTDENLNAPGMQFVPLAFEELPAAASSQQRGLRTEPILPYGVIARLALLAASLEIEQLARSRIPRMMQRLRKVAGAMSRPATDHASPVLMTAMKLAFILDPLEKSRPIRTPPTR